MKTDFNKSTKIERRLAMSRQRKAYNRHDKLRKAIVAELLSRMTYLAICYPDLPEELTLYLGYHKNSRYGFNFGESEIANVLTQDIKLRIVSGLVWQDGSWVVAGEVVKAARKRLKRG